MAWTTPRTWVAEETVTSSLMNTHTRDNLDYLKVNEPASGLTTPAYCLVHRTTSQTFSNAAAASVVWSAEIYDNDSMWSSGATITIQTAGTYIMVFRMGWESNATNIRYTGIYVNGSLTVYNALPDPSDDASVARSSIFFGPVELSVGDAITTYAYQNSGDALGTLTTAGQTPSMLVLQVA